MANNQIEDACKTSTTKEHSGTKRDHETPTKNSNVHATDESLGDDASSTSNINMRKEDSSFMNGDSAIGDMTIAGPAKRDAGSDVRESGEPPAKRARPRPRKSISPTSSSTADADAASAQATTRDHVDEMYANSE